MECGHRGRLRKGNLFVLKGITPYQVQVECLYCYKCKKQELSEAEKKRIKQLIDEESEKDETK